MSHVNRPARLLDPATLGDDARAVDATARARHLDPATLGDDARAVDATAAALACSFENPESREACQ